MCRARPGSTPDRALPRPARHAPAAPGYVATMAQADVTRTRPAGTFLGHPRGLATLFLAEMWERFSFYGMRAILVLYLVAAPTEGGLGMAATTAATLYGVYNAMVYMAALPGGWLADRVIGARRAVLVGGAVIAAGHFSLAVPTGATFVLGLVLIVAGTGLLKPNMSQLVGDLYAGDDARRDSGFSLFYMGVNLGAFGAPLLVGWLGESVNWHLGFSAAGVGMLFGLAQYVRGARYLGDAGLAPARPADAATRSRVLRRALLWLGVAAAALAVDVAVGAFGLGHVLNALTAVIVVVPVVYFAVILRDPRLSAAERGRVRPYVWLFLAAAVFWMIYDQAGSVLSVFAAAKTNRDLGFWTVPASWFQSVNPVMILLLAPVFAWLWIRWGSRQPGAAAKFAFGLVGVGLSFGLMALAARAAEGPGLVSPLWLVGVFLVQTIAELTLSPVGLSVTTRMAPAAFAGQLLGLWFLAVAVGDAAGGQAAKLLPSLGQQLYFTVLGALAVLVGIGLALGGRRLVGDADRTGNEEVRTEPEPVGAD
jgi:POT family proton-dependent oligopeptide transporter